MDESLELLTRVFCGELSDYDVDKLADHTFDGTSNEIKEKQGLEKITIFLENVKRRFKHGWKTQLREDVKKVFEDKRKFVEFVEFYLNGNHQDHSQWVLESWKSCLEMEKLVKDELKWTLGVQFENSSSDWLLEFLHLACVKEEGRHVIERIKQSMNQRPFNHPQVSGDESQHQNKPEHNSDQDDQPMDVDDATGNPPETRMTTDNTNDASMNVLNDVSNGSSSSADVGKNVQTVMDTYTHEQQKNTHLAECEKLAKEGKYLLEFRAVVADALPDDGELMLYSKDENRNFPMHYNEKSSTYHFLREVSKENYLHVYKFWILRGSGCIWEKLPPFVFSGLVCNKESWIDEDQRKSGHAILFEVVILNIKSFEDHQATFESNLLRLLPSWKEMILKEEHADQDGVVNLLINYTQWIKSYSRGVTVVCDYVAREKVSSKGILDASLKQHIDNEATCLAESHGSFSHLKRVLGMLVLSIVMENNDYESYDNNFKATVCNNLSIHDFDGKSLRLLSIELKELATYMESKIRVTRSSSFIATVQKVFSKLKNIPESILVLPLIKVSQVANRGSFGLDSPPSMVVPWQNLRTEFRKMQFQKNLEKIAERVTALSKSFSWLRKWYVETLGLETVANLISEDYHSLFDLNDVFTKIKYFWRELAKKYPIENLSEEVLVGLSSFLTEKLKRKVQQISEKKNNGKVAVEDAALWIKNAADLLDLQLKYVRIETPNLVGFVSHSFNLINCVIELAHATVQEIPGHGLKSQVDKFKEKLIGNVRLLIKSNNQEIGPLLITLWSVLLDVEWSDKDFGKRWTDEGRSAIHQTIPLKFHFDDEKLVTFHVSELEVMEPSEQVFYCFDEIVKEKLQEHSRKQTSKSGLARKIFQKLEKTFLEMTGRYQSSVFKQLKDSLEEQWQRIPFENKDELLKFLETWNPSLLLMICDNGLKDKLGSKLLKVIDEMERLMQSLIADLFDGSILVCQLHRLNDVKKAFWDCYGALQKSRGASSVDIGMVELSDLIQMRYDELNAFTTIKEFLELFCDFVSAACKDTMQVNFLGWDRRLSTDISGMPLRDLVDCRPYILNTPIPKLRLQSVKFFQIPTEYFTTLLQMRSSKAIQSSTVKQKMKEFLNAASVAEINQLTILEILKNVWRPASQAVVDIVQQIDGGIISLQAIEELFAKSIDDDVVDQEAVETELSILYSLHDASSAKPGRSLRKRLDQISNYFKLRHGVKAAEHLDKIRTMLKLDGNFDVLVKSTELGEQTGRQQLLMMNEKVSCVAQQLGEIGEDQLRCLVKFCDCENLVDWLKENMKDIGEVKVMSDLAMISAGETPMEVDRVSCFLSAVMGFSSLIFELPPKSGFDELLQACKEVWKNVERDPELLKKWEDTGKQLQWLDSVKDFHGSVEKSSLTRAQMINNEGAYEICCADDVTPTVENSLKLYLIRQNAENVVMTLSELRDLQSRLMLIAGEADKGKQDVNRFMNVLSNVENLTKAFVKLKMTGCSLFSSWKATVSCRESFDDELARNVTVEVYFDTTCPAVTSSKDVIEELINLTTVLNGAHRQWMNYLAEKRSEHYHLNHFNINQLTYLCKQLASCELENVPDQVYALLLSVDENVSADKIADYLDEATKINDSVDMQEQNVAIEDEEVVTDLERKKRVVRKLVQMELSVNMAKAAVQAVESLDVDECYLWALAHEDEAVTEFHQQFDEDVGFETKEANIKVIQNIVNDRSNLTLKEVINQIQSDLDERESESMATTVKTVCERYFKGTAVTSLEDCISLEHLGQFLHLLGRAAEESEIPQRAWPDQFVAGKPNLMMCRKKEEIWRTLLSLYMNSPNQPLPSPSEVLVCSETTTSEEVELLLRRALGKPCDEGKRIFCLACADELTFNVARETEEKFQLLVQMADKNEDYRLVIFASSLQHYITSCFDEHKVEGALGPMKISVEEYLSQHLCARRVRETAAVVDFERSSVRVVRSKKAGMGKSLYVSRRRKELSGLCDNAVHWNASVVRLLEKNVDVDDIVASLIDHQTENVYNSDIHFIHVDITPSVHSGVGKVLFDLLVLGIVTNSRGVVWRHRPNHFYALEYTDSTVQPGDTSFTRLLDLLPSVVCLSPAEVLGSLENSDQRPSKKHVLMDNNLLVHEMYQRPYQYLQLYANHENLDNFRYTEPRANAVECLQTLLRYCSIRDPSWSELSHFAKFLNVQLRDCENSLYCDLNVVGADSGLTGFKQFVVRFMIRMSQDFATPSLNEDDDENARTMDVDNSQANELFELHQLRRRWENGFHPYLFFNDDRVSMSFVHFNVSAEGNLCHPKTNEVVERNIMQVPLVQGLEAHGVLLHHDFDLLDRHEKLACLCRVFGVKNAFDPDPTYELTTDNVLKMLAIHMRFRCGIPVVVMGETGCGKTRMVEFMSKLKCGNNEDIRNMVIVKVHGGITVSVIQDRVQEAIELAKTNKAAGNIETILFLDEANTTEAIYAIKEIVCDGTVHGQPFVDTGLKIVAACNPYKAHSPEVIENMEQAGLGFHVKACDASETFAGIPMRQLVYRVISLPPSMKPLVWDFGQLNNETEAIYVDLMVRKLQADINADESIPNNLSEEVVRTISSLLVASQVYMRERRDVCSFVSLRDVERTIQSFKWFYKQLRILNPMIEFEMETANLPKTNVSYGIRALIEALGMCYHATLQDREPYRTMLSEHIRETAHLQVSEKDILNEIIACQNVFINAIKLEKDIAKNEALRENVFMMVVCAEMRIPLFLVGKPGSSKSLAKTIVTDAMQGRNSRSELFQQLKEIHVLSFQCSAISDAVGIEAVFSQCAQLQKERDLDRYVATVVLDEIGLAEGSKKMPLKVLHPLLENASTNSQLVVPPYCKVGFVGISNWALDPAKMNRGIFVTRGEPCKNDLEKTAKGIFESDQSKYQVANGVVSAVTDAYMEIYKSQDKEFFGLRDYYALLKMLFAKVSQKEKLTFVEIAIAVMRNFSGYSKDVLPIFQQHCISVFPDVQQPRVPVTKLIYNNLNSQFESRFLLLLTKQYSAVSLLHEVMGRIKDYQVIFGSSFPHDHDYTEVCRNINRIKVCMETGRTVVLLNLRDLYESLYDALNQHYVTFAGQRYVDLGLGGHRVKCRIATGFRLIVIEEKEIVYDEFPIPLINRLEKYVFEMNSVLAPNQITIVNRLKEWIEQFSKIDLPRYHGKSFTKEDAFVGYKDDTAASALLSVGRNSADSFEAAQNLLLQTASLDGICRLQKSDMQSDAEKYMQTYMLHQVHDTLWVLLKQELERENEVSVFEVVSFSQVLNERDRKQLQNLLRLTGKQIMLVTLQQFQTEQEFAGRLDEFFGFIDSRTKAFEEKDSLEEMQTSFVLLIQCPQADLNGNLIACAKYSAVNKLQEFKQKNPHLQYTLVVCFLFTLERRTVSQKGEASFTSFHSQGCVSVYVDELRPKREHISVVSKLWNMTISEILVFAMENAETDDSVIDIKRLLLESIPEAMAKLRNQVSTQDKNRIQLVTALCFRSEISGPFIEILFKQVLCIVQDRERKLDVKEQWIVEEACSAQSLQEGGSFRNALWLRLRKTVALALAKIVSLADADNNLELIADISGDNRSFANLWFEIFASSHICDFQNLSGTSSSSTFNVPGKLNFDCEFPFARTIYDIMNTEWLLVAESNADDKEEAFAEKIAASPLQGVLNASERIGLIAITRFIHDLVHLAYRPQSDAKYHKEEFRVLQACIVEMFKATRKTSRRQWKNALVEGFIILKNIFKSLLDFSEVIAACPEVLCEGGSWMKQQAKSEKFIAHRSAFTSLIQKLQDEAKDSFGAIDSCNQWKSRVVKTKQFAEKMLPDANAETLKDWKRILFVEIFLDQLVPASANNAIINRYLKPLSRHARLLWVGTSKINDLASLQFLKIVMKTLQSCCKEIYARLLCSWSDVKCRSCRADKLNDPVLLPCNHYICFRCVSLKPDSSCPHCRRRIPHPETLRPLELTGREKKELETFKSACTSFFLEYLSTLCFPPPKNLGGSVQMLHIDDKIYLALEELVICDKRTKLMSPLLGNLDENPTARSYILQLLLRSDANLVEHLLEGHFKKMEAIFQDTSILMGIYIQCKQDILRHQLFVEDSDENKTPLEFCNNLFQESLAALSQPDEISQIQQLGISSHLQFVAKFVASCIFTLNREQIAEQELHAMSRFVRLVCETCLEPKFLIFRQFVIKCLCRRHGMDAFNILLSDKTLKAIVPQNLVPAQDSTKEDCYLQSDLLVLSGDIYRKTKTTLLDIAQEDDIPPAVDEIGNDIQRSQDGMMQALLALSVWASHGGETNEMRRDVFNHVMTQSQAHLTNKVQSNLFLSISKGLTNDLRFDNPSPPLQYKLIELVMMFGVCVLGNQNDLLRDFSELARNPQHSAQLYLPAMPGSQYAAVRQVFAAQGNLRMHLCPNGHPYYIGECHRPIQVSKCTDCGAEIGGRGHTLLQGNRAGEMTEESQVGYKLKRPDTRSSVTPERKLTKLSVCATRFHLHAAMLLGALDGTNLSRLINVGGGQNEVFAFLLQHMMKDLNELSKCLGRSIDDTFIVMHQILRRMRTQAPTQHPHNLQSQEAREKWEEEYQRLYLAPIFTETTDVIAQAQAILIDAEKLSERPLERLVFELKQEDHAPQGVVPWDSPSLWRYRIHADLQHLRQTLEVISTGEGAALKAIVNTENLDILCHLHEIVLVQVTLISRYRQKIDMSDADEITIQEYLEEGMYYFANEIDQYIKLWNKIRHFKPNAERMGVPLSYFDEDMTLDSPISMCLPSRRGRGLCALLMVDYLVDMQNRLLHECRELVSPPPRFDIIDVGELALKDVICINENLDLLPLILENSQYEASVGNGGPNHNISYNLGLMQKKVMEKFFVGKSFIKEETIPLMQYPQDTGLAKDYETVQDSHEQTALTRKMCQDIDAVVDNAMTANICEAVRTLTLVIQFLAKGSKTVPEQTICDYAERELLLPSEETEMIPRSAQIRHCLALYERLSWHRSRRLVTNGQNPFENVILSAEPIEDKNVIEKLRGELASMKIDRLQLELNALLMVGPEVEAHWRLGIDVLLPYLEGKHDDDRDNSWCERIPEEILFRNSVHVFDLSMEVTVK